MELILGSKNPAKLYSVGLLFEGTGCSLTLAGVPCEAAEDGADPAENARIKAEYYAEKFGRPAIAEDSGLYFLDLPMDDPRQPGLYVRRVNGRELTDDEMIAHYSALAKSLGGRVRAAWYDGYAISFGKGRTSVFLLSREATEAWAFYLLDRQISPVHPGFPMDSISEVPPRTPEKQAVRMKGVEELKAFFRDEIEKHRAEF
ncbi:MAG: non-canonical purine NTP pyrophosphatase [Oscillospiraceae bacterium]|nr:non-canonical purine NTP pyrophosphatase [Oscillospiraceae bacterium]